MRTLLLLITSFCFYSPLNAQKSGQNKIDSLLLEVSKTTEDSTKVNLLSDISFTYAFLNTQEGIKYGNEALVLAKKINFTKGIAGSNLATGVNNNFHGNYDLSLEHLNNALVTYESIKNKAGIAKTLLNIGSNYQFRADFPKALEYNLKALKINEETNNKKETQKALNNIGNVYFAQSNFEKALDFYTKALEINKEIGYKKGMSSAYGNIGLVYEEQKNYKKAIEFNLKSLEIDEEIENNIGIAINVTNLSNAYNKINDYEKALDFGFKAVQLNEKLGAKREVSMGYGIIGDVYFKIATDSNKTTLKKVFGDNKKVCLLKAKDYIEQAIHLVQDGDLRQLYHSYQKLSEIQSQLGDNIKALKSYKISVFYKDSVFNIEKNNKITENNMQYEFDKKEELAKAEQEKKDIQQRNVRNIILLTLLTTLLFLFYTYRQRNKIAKEQQRSEALLLNILPAEVAEELKQTGTTSAKQYNNVTVLFTDFVNFTGISEKLAAEELVAEIHKNFTIFDQIIEKHGLEKIKTIGDAYLAVCGLPHENLSHAQNVVRAAIEINQYMLENNGKFQIRIGINSGSVVAGIVGVKKYAYDIWGDSVNTAARMEQNSQSGKINISGTTYELVKNEFNCIHRGKIEAKNKGLIDMYFVEN